MMLKLNGFDVYPYTDPEAALASFRRGQFDLLLLDIQILAMNGFELYRKIIQIDEKINVCFMTNYTKEYVQEFTKSFPELGHNHLVEKPAAAADLLKIVENCFNH
jgi:CheY-like chemotaxis protein